MFDLSVFPIGGTECVLLHRDGQIRLVLDNEQALGFFSPEGKSFAPYTAANFPYGNIPLRALLT